MCITPQNFLTKIPTNAPHRSPHNIDYNDQGRGKTLSRATHVNSYLTHKEEIWLI